VSYRKASDQEKEVRRMGAKKKVKKAAKK